MTSRKHDEKALQFVVQQRGAEVSGAILRVDGDTGTLTGSYKDGKFTLSHFSGARPASGGDHSAKPTAPCRRPERPAQDRSPPCGRIRRAPEASTCRPMLDQHTGVKDPTKPFNFSFPDLDGNIVSNTDERFQGKVVLINVTGSWCPNCHDEDEFLPAIYNKYHARGWRSSHWISKSPSNSPTRCG